MATLHQANNKKKKKMKKEIPWQQKKELTDTEEIRLQKDLDELEKWTKMMDSMAEDQLKQYLQNRPQELKTVKIPKNKARQRVQKVEDPKDWASYGIMASVWKFHQYDNDHLLS